MRTSIANTIEHSTECFEYLDKTHVLELVDHDLQLIQALLVAYLQSGPHDVSALMRAIQSGDRLEIARLAHRLRGSLRYLGASELEDLLLEVESEDPKVTQQELLCSYQAFLQGALRLEQEVQTWRSHLP